ncbi:LysR family transcriptional regulator [Alcaligenaceae bacterium C4P045]|nr:LysR family transcriptional regulator [Alcaligenaceae bacterium B3P038]MDQ2147669.1 LysR family transcriptional regulator [Alcaligenaceae bacterium C4P045]
MLNSGLKYFLEVAQAGSLSAASATLHVAISAISRQITRLEQEVGAPLFDRASRGMSLTPAGHVLLAHARRTALESEATLNAIASLHGSPGNLIRVSCAQGLSNDVIPAAIARFRKQFPDTRFFMWVGSAKTATDRVMEGESDIAVTFSVEPEPGIAVRHAIQSSVMAVMAKGHPLAGRKAVSMAEIEAYPLALTDKGSITRKMFDHSRGMAGVFVEPAVTTNYAGSLQAMVRESDSILLAGYVSMADRLARMDLVAVPLTDAEMHFRSVQIQVMTGRQLPERMEAFIEMVTQALNDIERREAALDGVQREDQLRSS